MSLQVGDKAPDFTLPGVSGKDFSMSDMKGRIFVLYFYPKNFTSVCTKEACEFRDAFSDFKGLEVDVIGVSQDSLESHAKFKAEHNLPFELLSDKGGKVSKLYKATVPIIGVTTRTTYLIDQDQKIAAVLDNMFNADKHIKSMLEALQ
ncbi:MAG: peroxiredoxin [Bernardetiaceae bacterium]|nr:peroxiredoxin [Bernardetiaceae bacterium]